jgi:hypothetical protein
MRSRRRRKECRLAKRTLATRDVRDIDFDVVHGYTNNRKFIFRTCERPIKLIFDTLKNEVLWFQALTGADFV